MRERERERERKRERERERERESHRERERERQREIVRKGNSAWCIVLQYITYSCLFSIVFVSSLFYSTLL